MATSYRGKCVCNLFEIIIVGVNFEECLLPDPEERRGCVTARESHCDSGLHHEGYYARHSDIQDDMNQDSGMNNTIAESKRLSSPSSTKWMMVQPDFQVLTLLSEHVETCFRQPPHNLGRPTNMIEFLIKILAAHLIQPISIFVDQGHFLHLAIEFQ